MHQLRHRIHSHKNIYVLVSLAYSLRYLSVVAPQFIQGRNLATPFYPGQDDLVHYVWMAGLLVPLENRLRPISRCPCRTATALVSLAYCCSCNQWLLPRLLAICAIHHSLCHGAKCFFHVCLPSFLRTAGVR